MIKFQNSILAKPILAKLALTFFLNIFSLTAFLETSISQDKPKSLIEGYSDGTTLFKVPIFQPNKINLEIDINSKYETSKDNEKQKSKFISNNKPKSLSKDYSEGFIVKQKIDNKPYVNLENKENKNIFRIPFKPGKIYKKTTRKPIIVIDPGHGGKDPGAIGRLGTKEKQITFLYSASLKKELERSGKYKVILTRYADNYVSLKGRVNKARKYNGDIFISIHADSISNPDIRGFSVYTISDNRVAREANKLLRKSDREEVIRGVKMRGESRDVKEAIIDFAQKETKSVSDSFSKIVARHLGQKVKSLRNTNREKSLAVLTGADIPSVLLELGYLSNRYEERLLRTKDHRAKIVKSIKSAIDEYFRKYDFFLE